MQIAKVSCSNDSRVLPLFVSREKPMRQHKSVVFSFVLLMAVVCAIFSSVTVKQQNAVDLSDFCATQHAAIINPNLVCVGKP
ncbi:hypothetical protein ACEN2T_17815 [Pseudomonas sp. W22_MBD1_FP4]|uniref:hypothetical protein n=1 Tax=Pseudomonas sp. W22_MBD1_FP4 TaxID=3240272 RepID=UPI003F97973E